MNEWMCIKTPAQESIGYWVFLISVIFHAYLVLAQQINCTT